MKTEQQNELKLRLAALSSRERKELAKRAAELRTQAQRRQSGADCRWSVEQWMLDLLRRAEGAQTMLVVESHGSRCTVTDGDAANVVLVHPDAGHVVPGDQVVVRNGQVREIAERKSLLSRRDPATRHKHLPIVANVDVAAVVVSCVSPPLHPRLIDRYLAAAWLGKMEPIIVLNKTDLHETHEALEADVRLLKPYEDMGVPVFTLSARDGTSEPLLEFLQGKVAVFVGHSGVGKSTLVNRLIEGANADTGRVSNTNSKGRHTTTASTLRESGGLRIVDTPGVREFGIDFASPAELAECFHEFPLTCRFPNCAHRDEDGCSVLEAVQAGTVSRARYASYRRLLDDAFPRGEAESGFVCRHCGVQVTNQGSGTKHRNHCPNCLHSVHLDVIPGDRLSACRGTMDPVSMWVRKGDEWAIIHRCRDCGHLGSNRIAADDNEMLLLSLAARPLARPPFPLDLQFAGDPT